MSGDGEARRVDVTGEEREFTQGREIQRIFDPGRKVSLSLSYTPF